MPIKLNISEKGKAWKMEVSEETLTGKAVGDKIHGKELKPELEGYEFEITGGSDNSGFALSKNVEGIGLRRVLLTKGWGMKDNYPGIRRKKTVRGKTISEKTSLVNLNVLKKGAKKLEEVFAEQVKAKEEKPKEEGAKEEKAPKEEKK